MADPIPLEREFALMAAYLGSPEPVRGGWTMLSTRYNQAHGTMRLDDVTRFDRWLVAIARAGTIALSLSDSYARRARPYGLLRRKLTLVLALLESAGGTHATYDAAVAASPIATWVALLALGVSAGVRTIAAVLILAPVHLVATILPGPSPRG